VQGYVIQPEHEGIVGNTADADIDSLIVPGGKIIDILGPSYRGFDIVRPGHIGKSTRNDGRQHAHAYPEAFQAILGSMAAGKELDRAVGAKLHPGGHDKVVVGRGGSGKTACHLCSPMGDQIGDGWSGGGWIEDDERHRSTGTRERDICDPVGG